MFDLIDEAKKFIQINSVTNTGNIEIVNYAAKLLDHSNIDYSIQTVIHEGVKQANIIAEIPGEGQNKILFNTHLDTVPPGDFKLWDENQNDPYNPHIDGDKIYGLGSADTKLDYLCKLQAILKYRGRKFKQPLIFVGTFGEEMGLIGCEYFLKDYPTENIQYAFVGEPTDLKIVYAHKGMIILNIDFPIQSYSDLSKVKQYSFKGSSAHGSTPHLGDNAIYKAIEYAADQNAEIINLNGGIAFNVVPEDAELELLELDSTENKSKILELYTLLKEIEADLQSDRDEEFDPPFSVMNVGPVKTDNGKLSLDITFRLLPERDIDCYYEKLSILMKKWDGNIKIKRHLHAMKTSKESPLIINSLKILNDLSMKQELITKPALTESSLYEEYAIESIVYGSGLSIDNIHKPNENNLISQMESSVRFYEKVIERFCLD